MRFLTRVAGPVVVAVAAIATVGFVLPSSAEPLAAGPYAALGDSYSSGTGAGDYDGSGCKRSANSYAQLWANANDPSSFSFVACSGAITSDVLNNQISALNSNTALVTISIGGNDAGFADVMIDCVLWSDSTCVRRNEEAREFARTELPGRLDSVYSAISSAAPNASVIVVGYPRMYVLSGDCNAGLSETKREAINTSADVLAEVIGARAAAHGFSFLDGRSAFAGHEICGQRPFWLHSVNWGSLEESYHPTADGQRLGYYAALESMTLGALPV